MCVCVCEREREREIIITCKSPGKSTQMLKYVWYRAYTNGIGTCKIYCQANSSKTFNFLPTSRNSNHPNHIKPKQQNPDKKRSCCKPKAMPLFGCCVIGIRTHNHSTPTPPIPYDDHRRADGSGRCFRVSPTFIASHHGIISIALIFSQVYLIPILTIKRRRIKEHKKTY